MDLDKQITEPKPGHEKTRELIGERSGDTQAAISANRERFLVLIKTRHGYTSAKAEDVLEKHLKQYSGLYRKNGIHRARLNISHLHSD
jgi:hypothetical protein